MSALRLRSGDERGAVFVFAAIAMVVLIGSTALAVDVGQLASKNRDLQAVADVVALDTARAIDGSTVAVLSAPGGPVTVAAQNSAARNDFPFEQLDIVLGTKTGSAAFVEMTDPTGVPNAVRVVAEDDVNFSFARGDRTTNRRATAVQEATVGFSVGSFMASVDTRGNALLDTIFLDSFGANATVLGYGGLVGSSVTLGSLAAEAGFLSPTELLTSNVSARELLLASASALPQDGTHTAAINVLNQMALGASTVTNIRLGDFIIAQQPAGESAAAASLDVLSLLTSSAFLIDGEHAVTLPNTVVDVPNVGGMTVELDVLEPPQIRLDARVGDFAETAQVSMRVTPEITVTTASDPEVNACSLQSLLGSLLSLSLTETTTCLLGGYVGRLIELELNASVPIELTAAGAKATLTDIACQGQQSITLHPEPLPLTLDSTVSMTLRGRLKRLNGTSLADLGDVAEVRAAGGVTTEGTAADQLFLHPSEFGQPRRVGSSPLGLAGLTSFETGDVTLLNNNLGPVLGNLLVPAVDLVNGVLGEIDDQVLGPLNELLGLNVGGADLTAIPDSLRCTGLRLAE